MANEHILRIKAVLDTTQLNSELQKIKFTNSQQIGTIGNGAAPVGNQTGTPAQGAQAFLVSLQSIDRQLIISKDFVAQLGVQLNRTAESLNNFRQNLTRIEARLMGASNNFSKLAESTNIATGNLSNSNQNHRAYSVTLKNVAIATSDCNRSVSQYLTSLKAFSVTTEKVNPNKQVFDIANINQATSAIKRLILQISELAKAANTTSAAISKQSTANQQLSLTTNQATTATTTAAATKAGGSYNWAAAGTASVMLAAQLAPQMFSSNNNLGEGEHATYGNIWGDAAITATQGAAMGMAFGPWGAAIGGFVGAIIGATNSLKKVEEDINNLEFSIDDSIVDHNTWLLELRRSDAFKEILESGDSMRIGDRLSSNDFELRSTELEMATVVTKLEELQQKIKDHQSGKIDLDDTQLELLHLDVELEQNRLLGLRRKYTNIRSEIDQLTRAYEAAQAADYAELDQIYEAEARKKSNAEYSEKATHAAALALDFNLQGLIDFKKEIQELQESYKDKTTHDAKIGLENSEKLLTYLDTLIYSVENENNNWADFDRNALIQNLIEKGDKNTLITMLEDFKEKQFQYYRSDYEKYSSFDPIIQSLESAIESLEETEIKVEEPKVEVIPRVKLDPLSDLQRFGFSTNRGELQVFQKELVYLRTISKNVDRIAREEFVGVYQ